MIENLEEKTNDELKSLIDDLTDEGATIDVVAKNPSKPNKTELITAIKSYYKAETDLESELESEEEDGESPELETKKKIVVAAKLPRSKRKKLQTADLFRKECVLITDTRVSQTPDKAMFVSWGNSLVGHQTDVINLEGRKPQYVRRGALENLKNATKKESYQNDKSEEIKWADTLRFMIIPAEGLSAAELNKKKVEQQIKLANAIN